VIPVISARFCCVMLKYPLYVIDADEINSYKFATT
jgi:hypothetical protein